MIFLFIVICLLILNLGIFSAKDTVNAYSPVFSKKANLNSPDSKSVSSLSLNTDESGRQCSIFKAVAHMFIKQR